LARVIVMSKVVAASTISNTFHPISSLIQRKRHQAGSGFYFIDRITGVIWALVALATLAQSMFGWKSPKSKIWTPQQCREETQANDSIRANRQDNANKPACHTRIPFYDSHYSNPLCIPSIPFVWLRNWSMFRSVDASHDQSIRGLYCGREMDPFVSKGI